MRLLTIMTLCAMPAAWCGTIGTTVTGDLNFSGVSTNYYDPGNGFVPATGYLNSSSNLDSPTVLISSSTTTFGYADTVNQDVADFSSGTQLVFTDTLVSGSFAGNSAITLTFTDPAFAGISLVSSTFGGLTYGIVGDVITINIPAISESDALQANAAVTQLSATFNVSTATTPEPSTFAMLAAGSAVLIWLRRKTA